jgi:8-oxo-dGTP diphosphatase
LWEFPGGKVEAGEDVQTCIVRELKEELGVRAMAGKVVATSEYTYPGGAILLVAVEAKLEGKDLRLTVHDQHAWIELQDLLKLDLAPADVPIAETVQQIYGKDLIA